LTRPDFVYQFAEIRAQATNEKCVCATLDERSAGAEPEFVKINSVHLHVGQARRNLIPALD
jgi:hypothetical protein